VIFHFGSFVAEVDMLTLRGVGTIGGGRRKGDRGVCIQHE
jgi:hypothetical protein